MYKKADSWIILLRSSPMRGGIEMEFDEYQTEARKTAVYPPDVGLQYTTLGLAGEAGEVANKVKKVLRGDGAIDKNAIQGELGDVLWYISNLATELGISMDDIAKENLAKLRDRMARGVLKGSGDNR